MNIAMVEHDHHIGNILQCGLLLSGNEVAWYHHAQECFHALLEARFNNTSLPDILLVDWELDQGTPGAELAKRLREFIRPAELPILVMSGRDLLDLNLISEDLFDMKTLQQSITPETLNREVQGPWPLEVN